MVGRNPARFLAPIALIAFAFALYSVVKDDEAPTGSTPASQSATADAHRDRHEEDVEEDRQAQDLHGQGRRHALRASRRRRALDLETLMELNPELDPADALAPGQKIRLDE